jgi:hypothetical protein
MAKGNYIGIDNVARKGKKMYFGVDNVARKVKKAYIGVDGVARLIMSGEFSTAVLSTGTLPEGYRFYNSGADAVMPVSGNSNVIEVFTGILPSNKKSYLYNFALNTITESTKQTTVDLISYYGYASTDGYMYFIHTTLEKVYKVRQSDFSVVSSADVSLGSKYYIANKCITDIGDYVYYFIYYDNGDNYTVRLYSLNKNTLELKYLGNSFTTPDGRYMGAVVHDGELYHFRSNGSNSQYFYGYKHDVSSGSASQKFYNNASPFGTGCAVLRAMELNGETYLFTGSHYQIAKKIFKVDYASNTVKLFAEIPDGLYIENWWHDGNGTIVSTYNSASSGTFTKLKFQ